MLLCELEHTLFRANVEQFLETRQLRVELLVNGFAQCSYESSYERFSPQLQVGQKQQFQPLPDLEVVRSHPFQSE